MAVKAENNSVKAEAIAMRTIVIGVTATALLAVLVLAVKGDRDPDLAEQEAPPMSTAPPSEPQDLEERLPVINADGQEMPQIDMQRLLNERGYQNDPAVKYHAEMAQMTPYCFVETLKAHVNNDPMPEGCPTGPIVDEEEGGRPDRMVVPDDNPYTEWSNAQLESAAVSDAVAAVMLARRMEDNAEARRWFERAVALTGDPGPLLEWMWNRETGGIYSENGVTDLAKLKFGYKIWLIAAEIEGQPSEALEVFEEELVAHHVDLREIKAQATAEAHNLLELRQQLTGGERP
ncbi:MAG: hypothetical protein ACREQ8_11030 [Woeseiaceae bacterium]